MFTILWLGHNKLQI